MVMFFRSKSVYENEKKEETTSLICSVSLCIQTYLNSDLFSNCFYLFLSILIYVENTLYYYYCKNKLYTIAEFPMRWGTQYFPRCHHSSYVESCWWCSSSHSFSSVFQRVWWHRSCVLHHVDVNRHTHLVQIWSQIYSSSSLEHLFQLFQVQESLSGF